MRAWMISRLSTLETVPRPAGSLSAHATGDDPVRLLCIGGSPLLGQGVLSVDLALQGALSRQLAAATGRGVDIQVIADAQLDAARARRELAAVDLGRFDAVVLVLGSIESILQQDPECWEEEVAAILETIGRSGIRVVVSSIPRFAPPPGQVGSIPRRIADRHAERLDAVLQRLVESAPHAELVEFDASLAPEGDRFRTSETFAGWARQFAPGIATVLADYRQRRSVPRNPDESRRQEALDRSQIVGTSPEERYDQIVHTARRMFGAAAAGLAFLDHDRQWFKAREGFEIDEIPREHAVCELTVRQDTVFVVPNLALDPRFAGNPYVTGPEHVRFYAGYRIESADGHGIGALCIFDTRPREFSAQDAVMLRELALMAQDELWADRPVAPSL